MEKILSREKISGIVEVMPDPTAKNCALLLRPTSFIEEKKLNIDIGSNVAFKMRTIMGLTKKEAYETFNSKTKDIITIKRKGWGEELTYKIQKI